MLTPIYYALGQMAGVPQPFRLVFWHTLGTVAVVFVGYQLYFYVQAHSLTRDARVISTALDLRIPLQTKWVWVYSLLYYVLLGIPVAFLASRREWLVFLGGGVVILLIALPVYILWPTATPVEWREFRVTGASSRFLRIIQSLDNGHACIPSMHCALSAYTATFVPNWPAAVLSPILVAISCVLVKQHSVIEIPASLALGVFLGIIIHFLK